MMLISMLLNQLDSLTLYDDSWYVHIKCLFSCIFLLANRHLTCKLDFCLSADNGPKCIGCDALINAFMADDVRVIDQQVPLYETVVWIRDCVDVSAVNFPPVDKRSSKALL